MSRMIDRLPAARRRLRQRRGVTIIEMLLCALIVSLSTALIVSTLTLGIRQFRERTRDSQAELLCNTLSLAVRDVLSCVSEVEDTDTVTFRTGAHGLNSMTARFEESGGKLYLQYTGVSGDYPLISDSGYTGNSGTLKAALNLSYNGGGFDVDLAVRDAEGQGLASNSFRVIPTIKLTT